MENAVKKTWKMEMCLAKGTRPENAYGTKGRWTNAGKVSLPKIGRTSQINVQERGP